MIRESSIYSKIDFPSAIRGDKIIDWCPLSVLVTNKSTNQFYYSISHTGENLLSIIDQNGRIISAEVYFDRLPTSLNISLIDCKTGGPVKFKRGQSLNCIFNLKLIPKE